MMGGVNLELLVVADCPHESGALSVLRLACERAGMAGQPVRTTLIASPEQARKRGFVGSPTILIDGLDPFAVPGQRPALACRVYSTQAGLSGVPPLSEVISALTAARDQASARPDQPG